MLPETSRGILGFRSSIFLEFPFVMSLDNVCVCFIFYFFFIVSCFNLGLPESACE